MATTTTMRVAVLGGLALSLFLPARASACGQVETCALPVRLLGDTPIPGNLVHFKVLVDEPGTLTLRHASDGRAIPASIRTLGSDRVFAPDEELPAGLKLELEYDTICRPGSELMPEHRKAAITTSLAAPAELPRPTLTVVEQGVAYDPGYDEREVAWTRVQYAARSGCSLAHLVDATYTIDGRAAYGNMPLTWDLDGETTLRALCDQPTDKDYDSCGRPTLVGVGRHVLEARTTIVGHADVLTSLSVEVDCTKPSSAASAETAAADVAASQENPQQGGCSLAESWRTKLSQIFSFTVLPLLLRTGRRRKRSASAGDRRPNLPSEPRD